MHKTEAKYFINVDGEMLTISEFSDRYDLIQHTVRSRYMRGIRDWRELAANNRAGRPNKTYGLDDETPDYSYTELWELYTYFAGQANEAQILADFAGVSIEEIRPILEQFRRKWYGGKYR